MSDYLLHLVHNNPWNERELDQENVDRIAVSIKSDTMLKSPLGRPDPDAPGAIQLAFGHHRLAAYRQLSAAFEADKANVGLPNPWAAIPVEVRDISDRDMARYAIIENHHRSDPSAIEKARALLKLTTDPRIKVSQAEAGALFGLGQTGVSHLTSLLHLPGAVQALVDKHELPEVPARQLVPLTEWRPDLVLKIAEQAVAEKDHAKRAGRVDMLIDEALRRQAINLDNGQIRPWPMEWPGKPEKVPMDIFMRNRPNDGTYQTVPPEVPACTGCPFNLKRNGTHFCLRGACFDTKHLLWAEREVDRVAEKIGIPAAAPGEATVVVYPSGTGYNYEKRQQGQKLAASKLPHLRIVARARDADGAYIGDSYGIEDVLGSKGVALATVNQAAVVAFLNQRQNGGDGRATKVPVKSANETPAQSERRKVAEKELQEERALERMAYNRSRADVLWIVEHTAELIAAATVAGGGMLLFAIYESKGHWFQSSPDEFVAADDELEKRAGLPDLNHGIKDNSGKLGRESTPELDRLRRQYLAYVKLGREVAGQKNATAVFGDFARAHKECESIAVDTFGIDLPAGWDAPPIHHTPINCWTCGRFSAAGAGKLTQADVKEGWYAQYQNNKGVDTVAGVPGAKLVGVFCHEHRTPALSKRMSDLAQAARDSATQMNESIARRKAKETAEAIAAKPAIPATPAKPGHKPTSNSRAAAAAAARAQVIAQAAMSKGKHVHGHPIGHSRPAPKPSAKKAQRKTTKKGK